MTLQQEMFQLIRDWKSSKLRKDEFLASKKISKVKFGYWLVKYNREKDANSINIEKQNTEPIFKEITFPDLPQTRDLQKVFELNTPSGLKIVVFE